jgi:hypothetical protein
MILWLIINIAGHILYTPDQYPAWSSVTDFGRLDHSVISLTVSCNVRGKKSHLKLAISCTVGGKRSMSKNVRFSCTSVAVLLT